MLAGRAYASSNMTEDGTECSEGLSWWAQRGHVSALARDMKYLLQVVYNIMSHSLT